MRSTLTTTLLKAVGLSLLAAGAAWMALWLSNASTLFNAWDDLRWKLLPPRDGTPVFLIDIDEQSLAVHGRWPWPREQLAELLGLLLDEHQAAVVGVDIILSEASDSDADRALGALDPNHTIWAQAVSLAGEPVVNQGVTAQAPPCPADHPWNHPVNGWLGLARDIASDGFRAGHIRPWPDRDQVVRRYQPFLPRDGDCMPALGLAMYAALLELPPDTPLALEEDDWRWGGIPLGLDHRGQLHLIWRADLIRSMPAHRVLAGNAVLPANAILVVGSSAVGIGDFVRVPGVDRFPGAGVHALAMRQWLDRDFISSPPGHDLLVWSLLLPVFGIFWFTSRRTALVPWLTAAALFFTWHFGAWLLWQNSIYLATTPMLWMLLWLPPLQGLRLWQERRARTRIYSQFRAYVPEKVLKELVRSRVDPRQLQAESREITILFADLRGFTSLSETMAPEAVVALLNEVMDYLCRHISAFEGTLDKFIGDGLMAFWGSPVAQEDHADRAVSCARAMLDDLDQLNVTLRNNGMPAVQLGIGINSGRVAVGNMGSASRRNYSAVGDAVNTAARLQQFCKTLGCDLLIGADTAALCKNQDLVELQTVELRGKKNHVTVYTSRELEGSNCPTR
ncbi:MAG: adenylate/guanylate cyclase domain-containing protein [Porticoccaceae bacterium]